MYVRTGHVLGSKDFTGCTPCWEKARLLRYDHLRADRECAQYWEAVVSGHLWKDGELWDGGRFFCEGCFEPSPEEVAAAKAAGLALQQPGNMTLSPQEARGDAGQEAVYMVDDTAFEVPYADVETNVGAFQSQPFYKGGQGRCLKMKLEGRVHCQGLGQEVELTWHSGDGSGRAPPRAEVQYRDGSVRQVEDFKWCGRYGGEMTWQWSMQGGILAPGQGTKPHEASTKQARTERARPPDTARELGSEGTGERGGAADLKASQKVSAG